MKRLVLLLLIYCFVSYSCHQEVNKKKIVGGDPFKVEMSIIPDTIPLTIDNVKKTVGFVAEVRSSIGLPSYFTQRQFIKNPAGFVYNLDKLVGRVAKINSSSPRNVTYDVLLDFKQDTAKISLSKPSNPTLVELKYDRTMSLGAQYLVASANIQQNQACLFLVSDLLEATINDNKIDMNGIYSTYKSDRDSSKYYLITSAVSTSILYKYYTKTELKVGFNSTAININGAYYAENSSLNQDFKVGTLMIPITEIFKKVRQKKIN